MDVLAIDVSTVEYCIRNRISTYLDLNYINSIVHQLNLPMHVLRWSNEATTTKYTDTYPDFSKKIKRENICVPETFIDLLTDFHGPINLHVLPKTSTVTNSQVKLCQQIFQGKKHLTLNSVNLHFDDLNNSEFHFHYLNIFKDFPVKLYLNKQLAATIQPLDFDKIDYDFIMKDDSFFYNTCFEDRTELAEQVFFKILKSRGTIQPFYASSDIDGCVKYVQKYSPLPNLYQFTRKIEEFSYGMGSMDKVPDSIENKYDCFVMKSVWLQKNLQSPFACLESETAMKMLADSVVCFTVRHSKLDNVFLLHNDALDPKDLIYHNDHVLSRSLEHVLPGCPALWQIVFLYVLAEKKFTSMRERLYDEIRYLAENAEYFVTLNPYSKMHLYEKLNVAFWYVAKVSHRAFENSKHNMLRSFPFNSRLFLQFYKNVFDKTYRQPEDLSLWRLWRSLCLDKSSILPILSHYFQHKKLKGDNVFSYVLLNNPSKKRSPQYNYLADLDLSTVLKVYRSILNGNECSAYKKIEFNEQKVELTTETSSEKLFHEYCAENRHYPKSPNDLLMFFNKYLYKQQKKIPKLFPRNILSLLDEVIKSHETIMNKYSCAVYLREAKNVEKSEEPGKPK